MSRAGRASARKGIPHRGGRPLRLLSRSAGQINYSAHTLGARTVISLAIVHYVLADLHPGLVTGEGYQTLDSHCNPDPV